MADEYGFTAQQREMLEELLKPDYDDIFLSLIGNYQPGGTPIGPVDISDIQGTLPDDLDPAARIHCPDSVSASRKGDVFLGRQKVSSSAGTAAGERRRRSLHPAAVRPARCCRSDWTAPVLWTGRSITPRAVHTCPDAAVAQPHSMAIAPTLHGQTHCPAISSFTRMTVTSGSSAATTAWAISSSSTAPVGRMAWS